MSRVLINEQYLTDLADSIRAKAGTTESMNVSEMKAAVDGIQSGASKDELRKIIELDLSEDITINSEEIKSKIFYGFYKYNGSSFGINAPNLKKISIGNAFAGYSYTSTELNKITKFNAPLLENLEANFVFYATEILDFNIQNLKTCGNSCFKYLNYSKKFSLPYFNTIGEYCFEYSTIPEIEIGTALDDASFVSSNKIPSYCFHGCTNLKKADIKTYGVSSSAFNGASKLTTLIIRNEDRVVTLSSTSAFDSTPIKNGSGFIYVPDNLIEQYKAATNWSVFADNIKGISEYKEA